MAIITLAQYKSLTGSDISDTTKDTQIQALIPQVEADILEICNRDFANHDITFSGDFVPTVAAGPVYSFVCSDGGISAVSFSAGDCLIATGSTRNDGRYTSSAFSDTAITIVEPVVSEAEVSMMLTLIQYPKGLALYAAKMLKYLIDHGNSAGMSSESIGKYSYTRANSNGADLGYPSEIIGGLKRSFGFIKIGKGQKRAHYTETRGNYIPEIID
jgi:hypothetical protein